MLFKCYLLLSFPSSCLTVSLLLLRFLSVSCRGIAIIQDPSASAFKDWDKEVLVQQLVRPYLINNRLW
jgi:hypothetical protein